MKFSIENLDFSMVGDRLNHLSNDDIVVLIKKYYDGVKVSQLLEEYNIDINPSQLYTLFPPVKSDYKCRVCDSYNIYYLQSKTSSSYSWSNSNNRDEECSKCGHKENMFCNCQFCISDRQRIQQEEEEKRKKLLERKKQIIYQEYHEDNWEKINETDLGLKERLYLAVVIRASLSEDTSHLQALENKLDMIAPTKGFTKEIVATLYEQDILVPHINSNLNAFNISEEEEISYYIYRVNYRINIKPMDNDYDEMLKRLMYPNSNLFENDKVFCLSMWRKIALEECLEYLLYRMNKVGYSFNPGEKTIKVLEHLLENFSVGQIYNIIYRAIAYSTTRYQEGGISKSHAQNLVISSCEKQGERAIAEKWNLKPYDRIKDLPQTLVSEIFFTSILKISELGFMEKPTGNL